MYKFAFRTLIIKEYPLSLFKISYFITLKADATKLIYKKLIFGKIFRLGNGLCPGGTSSYQISKFHLWFHRGVAQWLDIALYKAMQRIEKAAELDNLKPVDSSVKYSSSAVDTLAIFYQVSQMFFFLIKKKIKKIIHTN